MKLEAALKKIRNRAKKVDREVSIDQADYHGNGQVKVYARFENSNQTISFWTNRDGTISSPHLCRDGDVSAPHTDYFAGYFLDNATQFCNTFCPPAAKFAVGCLVRGKQNKRAIRMGYAGKVGLVTKAGGNKYFNVEWVGEAPSIYNSFPERDFELVAAA